MDIQVVTMPVQELLGIINNERENAYAAGYVKAKAELEQVRTEPKFGEILTGAKELHAYLKHKEYCKRSLSYVEKAAPQLIKQGSGERQGSSLIFHTFLIDKAFEGGFKFGLPVKTKKHSKQAV